MEREQVDGVMEVAANIAGKADQIKRIFVLYSTDNGTATVDNGMTVGEVNLMIDAFKFWMLHCLVVKE